MKKDDNLQIRKGKSLFIIADTDEIMEQVMKEVAKTLEKLDGVEYGWDDEQPIN